MTLLLDELRNDDEHAEAMAELASLWGSRRGTAEGERLDRLLSLIDAYETRHHGPPFFDAVDPIDAIAAQIHAQTVTAVELEALFGSADIAQDVLARRRELTLDMIRRLHARLGISADILIQPIRLASAA